MCTAVSSKHPYSVVEIGLQLAHIPGGLDHLVLPPHDVDSTQQQHECGRSDQYDVVHSMYLVLQIRPFNASLPSVVHEGGMRV